MTPSNEIREQLASLQHEQWSGWMEYLFSKFYEAGNELVMPRWAFERWKRQMTTPYSELPEEEKESDRIEADKYLPFIDQAYARFRDEMKQWVSEKAYASFVTERMHGEIEAIYQKLTGDTP